MAYERHWEEAPERPISSDGGADGSVTLSDLSGFYVKQQVTLKSNAVTSRVYQVKKIDVYNSKIFLGDVGKPIGQLSNLSDFTLADSATIKAEKQPKNTVPKDDQTQGTYETEPVVARRVVLVDEKGQKYNSNNPLPVDAALNVDNLEIDVSLDALTPENKPDPDSVLIAGSEDGTKTGIKHAARVDSELDLRVGISDGNNKASVDSTGKLSVHDIDVESAIQDNASILTDILNRLNQPLDIEGEINANLEAFTNTPDNVLLVGSNDGSKTGTKYGLVNTRRQQILSAEDREEVYFYADFGTKNQRIIEIQYTSSSFPGITVSRMFNYVLDGTRYRRTSSDWSII